MRKTSGQPDRLTFPYRFPIREKARERYQFRSRKRLENTDVYRVIEKSVCFIAIVSSDYHIATGELLFSAEAILRSDVPGEEMIQVISNASWNAPSGYLSTMFQAGALIELSGDVDTAFEIYYDNYDIHELPPLHQDKQ